MKLVWFWDKSNNKLGTTKQVDVIDFIFIKKEKEENLFNTFNWERSGERKGWVGTLLNITILTRYMAFQLTLIRTNKASQTRIQATVGTFKVQNKLLLISKVDLCLLISRQYTRKLISENFVMHIFDRWSCYLRVIANQRVCKQVPAEINREKFGEYAHELLHSDKQA